MAWRTTGVSRRDGMFGVLGLAQEAAIRPRMKGKEVVDFGCGNFALASKFLSWGARRVVGVDVTDIYGFVSTPQAEFRRLDFADWRAPVEVAFMSWPQNNWSVATELGRIAGLAETVVYLGKNTDGTACGGPGLFKATTRRSVEVYVPNRQNVLLVLGARMAQVRVPTSEEWAALNPQRILDWEDAIKYDRKHKYLKGTVA